MKQAAAYIFQGLAVVSGGLCAGAFILVYLTLRDGDTTQWVYILVIGLLLFLLCATSMALGITLHDPRQPMRRIPAAIAVARSGAPEITDPMPGPARVKRPVSGYMTHRKELFPEGSDPSQ